MYNNFFLITFSRFLFIFFILFECSAQTLLYAGRFIYDNLNSVYEIVG